MPRWSESGVGFPRSAWEILLFFRTAEVLHPEKTTAPRAKRFRFTSPARTARTRGTHNGLQSHLSLQWTRVAPRPPSRPGASCKPIGGSGATRSSTRGSILSGATKAVHHIHCRRRRGNNERVVISV